MYTVQQQNTLNVRTFSYFLTLVVSNSSNIEFLCASIHLFSTWKLRAYIKILNCTACAFFAILAWPEKMYLQIELVKKHAYFFYSSLNAVNYTHLFLVWSWKMKKKHTYFYISPIDFNVYKQQNIPKQISIMCWYCSKCLCMYIKHLII